MTTVPPGFRARARAFRPPLSFLGSQPSLPPRAKNSPNTLTQTLPMDDHTTSVVRLEGAILAAWRRQRRFGNPALPDPVRAQMTKQMIARRASDRPAALLAVAEPGGDAPSRTDARRAGQRPRVCGAASADCGAGNGQCLRMEPVGRLRRREGCPV